MYLFTRSEEGSWEQSANITSGDVEEYDMFGSAVEISVRAV